ncbi:MAG: acetate--CoA ligase family protein [Chloroflexota bacterium]
MPTHGDLQALLAPRSIALVGASADRSKLSGLPLHFLQKHQYPGAMYPIHPRAAEIAGLQCYPSLRDVGERIDLAFLLVGAERVLDVIDECLAVGVGAAIIAASGFAEVGGEGAALQAELLEHIQGTGLRVLGPNCMGFVNVHEQIAASFSQSLFVERLLPGGLAFFSQSGAIGGSTLDMAFSRGIGLSHWVSTGNQADVDVVECALAVIDDPVVRVIGLYLEGLLDPDAYVELLIKARDRGKSVLTLKSGQSTAGAQAAISHTAALVGNAAVFSAVSRQFGAIQVQDLEELLDRASGLLSGRTAHGARVGVVSSSGGVGVILADETERQEMSMASFSPETQARLARVVPAYGSTNNPVDATATLVARMIGGEAGLWTECFAAVAQDPNVDLLIVGLTMITGVAGETLAGEVIAALEQTQKPVLVCWLGADLCRAAFDLLRAAGVPMFTSTARTVRAASTLTPALPPQRANVAAVVTLDVPHLRPGPGDDSILSEWQCQPLLAAAGIGTPSGYLWIEGHMALPPDLERAERFVVKVQSPDIMHKSELGAVMLPVSGNDLSHACQTVIRNARAGRPAARVEGVLIQELVTGGVEMLVSVVRDPWFGLMLTLGFGGTLTELLRDVSSRRLPVTEIEVRVMLSELSGSSLLHGLRGAPESDIDGLVLAVTRVASLAESIGHRLQELEINPLLVLHGQGGAVAADCLIRLRE